MRYIIVFLLAAMPSMQAPGEGCNLVPSPPREIRTLYWELFDSTEMWVRIAPTLNDGTPAPISLIFSAVFPGKTLPRIPAEINVRAQSDPLFVAPEFTLRPVPGKPLDLTASGANYLNAPGCTPGEACAVTGIVSTLRLEVLRQIIQAGSITAEILGLRVSLQKADADALQAFVKRLGRAR